MWTLSGFIDEISSDFTEQCKVASGLGLKYTEVRSAWNINILDLTPEQLTNVQETLADHGLAVSSIGSPIGKIYIDEEFGPHLDRMKHAAEVAHQLSAPYIRIFSFFLRPGATPADHRERGASSGCAPWRRVAEDADLVLLHENEKDIYGDVPSRCLDVVRVRGLAAPAPRLGPGQLRAGRCPAVHGGIPDAPSAPGVRADQGRAGEGRHGRDRGRRATASSRRPSAPYGMTGSTGSSRSNHTWAPRARPAPSPARSCWRQAHADFTELLRAEGIEYA